MVEIGLRMATSSDVPALLDLMEDFNALEQIPWSRVTCAPALARLLGDPSLGFVGWLVREEARVGYVVLTWGYDLEWSGRDAFLTEIYLVPTARGKGLGALAIAEVERVAREHGARALHLMVRPENTVAVRMYERAGYRDPGRLFLSLELWSCVNAKRTG